jgi:hypothetical protein
MTPFLEAKSHANLLQLLTLNKVFQSLVMSAAINQSTGCNVTQALKLQHLKQNCGQDIIFTFLYVPLGTTKQTASEDK